MNGIEFLRQVERFNPLVKTMLMSVFEVENKLIRESNCVDKLLQKPIALPDLLNEIESRWR